MQRMNTKTCKHYNYEDNKEQYHPLQGVCRHQPVRRAVHPGRHGCNVALGEP